MKKYLLSLITFSLLLCEASFTGGMVFADASGSCGTNMTWSYTTSNSTLTISQSNASNNSMTNWTSSNYTNATTGRPWQSYIGSITKIVIAGGVKTIGNYAFRGMTAVTSVTYQSTVAVTSIGQYAFYGCTGITSLSVPSTVTTVGQYAYSGCTGGTSLSIPISVTSIGNYAFNGCSNVTSSLTFGGSNSKLESIGNYAFQNCSKISSITIPKKVTSIGSSAFNGCAKASTLTFTSPSTVTTIGGSAFKGCEKLTTVTIPASVTTMTGIDVFWNCTSLKTVTFEAGSTLTTFGNYLFEDCTSLTSVTFPSNLTAIPAQTFHGCTALETLIIPSAVTSITNSAFTECSALKTIIAYPSTHPTLSGEVTCITPANVRVAVFSEAAKSNYSADTYWSAFDVDTKIEGSCGTSATYSLDLTDGTLTISGSGSMDTYSTSVNAPWYLYRDLISSVVVESGITGIGAYAFRYCENITSVSIPASVTSIGSSAFDNCKGLASYSYAGTLAQWLDITFSGSSSNPMYYVKKCYVNGSSEITNLVIPNGTETIKNYAFYNCTGLTSVTLPASLTSVGTAAFSTCTNISNVDYKGDINAWCSIAFAANTSNPAMYSRQLSINGTEQTDIYLADDLALIKAYVFQNNDALTRISLKNTTTINSNALTGCNADLVVRGELTGSCGTGLTWSLLDGVLTVSYSSGTGVMSTYSTGSAPWYPYRKSITKVVIGEGVTTVGAYTLYQFTQTCGVFLPSTLTQLNNSAFYSSTGIAYIVSAASIPPTVIDGQSGPSSYSSSTFYNVPTSAIIYVPSGSETAYSTAVTSSHSTSDGWKCFRTFVPSVVFSGTCGATGNEDNVTWTYDPVDKSLTISGTGAMANYATASAMPWNSFKTSITSLVIEDGVTTIGDRAFYGCTALASVTFPETFTSFGNYVFYNCTGLTSIALPEGITATGNSLCYGCTSLASVTLPSTLTSIGSSAFHSNAFTSITIPASVTTINSYAFKNCASLTSISLPNITTLNEETFSGCSGLESVTLPNSLTSIKKNAFINCSSLASITIPLNVTEIVCVQGSGSATCPFSGCTSLTSVQWDARNCGGFSRVGQYQEYAMPFESIKVQITSFAFGSNVQSIPTYVCHGMTGLSEITIPASVISIGANAFNDCSSTLSVTCEGTTPPTLGSGAFSSPSTKKLYLPHNVAAKAAYRAASGWSSFTEANTFPKIVQFDLNGQTGDAINPQYFDNLTSKASAPSNPADVGYYTFDNWYENAEGTGSAFAFNTTNITADKTLYAKWTMQSAITIADNADNTDLLAAYDGQTVDVTLTRTIRHESYNTICLPFALTSAQVTAAFGADCDIEEMTGTNFDGDCIDLEFTQRSEMEAGKPYLIQPKATVANPSWSDVTITKDQVNIDGFGYIDNIGIFSRTYLENSENLLFLRDQNTLYMSSGGYMNGLRSYFVIKSPAARAAAAAGKARLVVRPNGVPTVIGAVKTDSASSDGKYIIDGQLVIIRDGVKYNAQGLIIQ